MRFLNLRIALILFLTQCTIVSSAPQRFAERIKSAASVASLESAAATATGSSSQTATVTSNAGAASTTLSNGSSSSPTTGANAGVSNSVTGTDATPTQAATTSTNSNSAECSDTPDASSCGGGSSNGDGSTGSNSGNGSGSGNNGSGSDSNSDTAAQNQSNSSGLSTGQLAAVITLPILAFLAIVICLFFFCRRRWSNWRQARAEKGAYRRTLDDPVMSQTDGGKQKLTGPRFRENIMRPLSFGFSQPADQSIRRKPLNWDANNIGATNGFSSIGMAVPMPENGDESERRHLRNQSEVSEPAVPEPSSTGDGDGRTKSLGQRSAVSAMSTEEEVTRVDATQPPSRRLSGR